ncbi:MAG: hypothetical protein AB7K35_17360 [Pseudorhodoplanes sp.]
MKKLMISALVAGQIFAAAQPAMAAELVATGEQQVGAFGGFRLRIPFDGHLRQREIRAGLTVSPTLSSQSAQGEIRTRIGEGLEFGYRSDRRLSLSIAGMSMRQLRAAQGEDQDGDDGVPTWALIVGGVAVAAGVGVLLLNDALNDASE